MLTLKNLAEKYEYYFDEEDTKLEQISHENGGFMGNDDLEILKYWKNERTVVPLEFVRRELERFLDKVWD